MAAQLDVSNAADGWTSIVDVLRWRSLRQPTRCAYTFLADEADAEERVTYAELDERARSIGGALQDRGCSDRRILLLCPPGLDYIATLFGCLYAGAIPIPAYPPPARHLHRGIARLAAIAQSSQAQALISTPEIVARAEAVRSGNLPLANLQWLTTRELAEPPAGAWNELRPPRDAVALLQYTSGSTSSPKGVILTHDNLLHNLSAIREGFRLDSGSRTVLWLPPYHDMGLIGGILAPLYAGFPVVLFSPLRFIQKPVRWLNAISRHRAVVSGGPNFAYDVCVNRVTPEQRDGLDLSSWRVAFNGAEPVRAQTLERFAATFAGYGFKADAFHPCYGLAEATLFVTAARAPITRAFDRAALERGREAGVDAAAEPDTAVRTLVGCGHERGGTGIAIVDPDTRVRCALDRVGEIWVSGRSVSHGYWNREQETANVFRARTADTDEGPFLRTGDLGFIFEGELFVTGRIKELIVIRGRNHDPHDIELTVETSHPGLQAGDGAAFTVDADGVEALVVVQAVERPHIGRLSLERASQDVIEAVARHHGLHATYVLFVKPGMIPKTSSGKIRRDECCRQFIARTLEHL